MNLLQTLLHPDQEELQNPQRRAIGNAANALQIGEFQLLQLAYFEWYGKDLPSHRINELFHVYMMEGIVPHWARHYALQIKRLESSGRLDMNQPHYHRYDSDYKVYKPNKARNIVLAIIFLSCLTLGSIVIAQYENDSAFSQFPPFISEKEMLPTQNTKPQ